ncbi:HD domain-containing phosphohydrolase [Campylobacterota bacterium]
MFKDGKLTFKDDAPKKESSKKERFWNVLIVDDDPGIHEVSKLALAGFEFDRKKCRFISAYSAQEAKDILEETPNIALALVDVVMETDHAGLDLVNYIRNELHNKLVRVILRTGQPGQAPEEKVIHDYDINDYKGKSELTTQKLYTSVLTSLRTYRDMVAIEKNRQGLKKIISSSSSIEKVESLEIFLSAVLEQLAALLHLTDYDTDEDIPSFIAAIIDDKCFQIAGSGRFKNVTKEVFSEEANTHIRPFVMNAISSGNELYEDGRYVIHRPSVLDYSGFVLYMELDEDLDDMDKDLIRLFFDKATVAYENAALTEELEESQREIIFTISEIAEQRSNETGQHVKRVALYSKLLAKACGLSRQETENIYVASPMHDIGKMAIPDNILKKPGALTDEEMSVMKTHASVGYEMLKSSKRDILKMSAVIAEGHHEKYDGSGYPKGLMGEEISIYARIVALADVFDALGSRRVYKEKWEMEKILAFIKEEKGKHFDPRLVDLFFENIDEIIEIHNNLQD